MKSDDLASRLRTQLQQCEGFDGDEISIARTQALNYYFQRARGDEVEGRAAVVSGDVSAMVEATVAAMMEAFGSGQICDFDPMSADDEQQARLESEAVHYYVMGRNNGFLEILSAIKEALLMRNGVVKIEAVDKLCRKTKHLENVAPETLGALTDPDDVVAFDYDAEKRTLLLTREYTHRDLEVRSVSLENFLYKADWCRNTLEGIPVCAERHLDTRADLIACFPEARAKIELLPVYNHGLKSESYARDPQRAKKPETAIDNSQDIVEWYEVYARVESGGVDELRRIALSYNDAVILDNVPVPFIRLAAGTCIINPHRFTGISLYDKLKQTQDMRTGLRRALLDNINATTKNRLAVLDAYVNIDDVTDGRVNNAVRVSASAQSVGNAIMPLAVPDTSANILANLESTARERSEMGGAALDMQSAQMQVGGDRMGSQGLDRAYSVAEQLSAAMMKTIASTLLRDVFLLAHRTLREYFDEPLPFKKDGKWQYVKPSLWPERTSVTVKPGMSPGERTRRANALGEVLRLQLMLEDKGMDQVLVGINQFNQAVIDWCHLMEVKNPEQYFIDPQSDASKAALQSKQQQASDLDKQKKTLMQTALGLKQLGEALDKYKHDSELQFKYFNSVLNSEGTEAQIVGNALTNLARNKLNGGTGQTATAGPGESVEGEQAAAPDLGETPQ